jgi:hypothetical protein
MVVFDEEAHTYTEPETGKRYLSATQLVGLFKQEFDTKGISERYAKKHGGTPEYWVQVWEDKKNRACARGTAFHKAKEDYINGRGLVVFNKMVHFAQNQAFFEPDNFAPGVYTEMLLWNDAYELAGQSDIVIIRGSSVVNSIYQTTRIADLDDHKTNETIHETSYFNNYTKQYKMMKYPLDHLMDCSLVHYELQLSIWRCGAMRLVRSNSPTTRIRMRRLASLLHQRYTHFSIRRRKS